MLGASLIERGNARSAWHEHRDFKYEIRDAIGLQQSDTCLAWLIPYESLVNLTPTCNLVCADSKAPTSEETTPSRSSQQRVYVVGHRMLYKHVHSQVYTIQNL